MFDNHRITESHLDQAEVQGLYPLGIGSFDVVRYNECREVVIVQ